MARIGAVLIWLLVVASMALWGVRTLSPSSATKIVSPPAAPAEVADLGPLLGRTEPVNAPLATAPELAARFRLVGVMAPLGTANGAVRATGVALLAIDGKPPRAYRVGAKLDRELMLQAVGHRTATIATVHGEPRLKLELPPNEPNIAATTNALATSRVAMPAATPLRPANIPDLEDAERQLPRPGDPIAPPPPPGPDPQQQAIDSNSR